MAELGRAGAVHDGLGSLLLRLLLLPGLAVRAGAEQEEVGGVGRSGGGGGQGRGVAGVEALQRVAGRGVVRGDAEARGRLRQSRCGGGWGAAAGWGGGVPARV